MSTSWWQAAGVRALKTFAQVLVATIPSTIVISQSVDWMNAALAAINILIPAVLAAGLSLLTSIAGLPELDCKDPTPPPSQ